MRLTSDKTPTIDLDRIDDYPLLADGDGRGAREPPGHEDEGAPEVPDLRGPRDPADPTPWRPNPFEFDLMEDAE